MRRQASAGREQLHGIGPILAELIPRVIRPRSHPKKYGQRSLVGADTKSLTNDSRVMKPGPFQPFGSWTFSPR